MCSENCLVRLPRDHALTIISCLMMISRQTRKAFLFVFQDKMEAKIGVTVSKMRVTQELKYGQNLTATNDNYRLAGKTMLTF